MTAIETRGLEKRFGDVVAVDALDLTVARGEVFGFLGPNGAGKSTTINLLLGFLDPTDGDATVMGHDVVTASRAVRSRTGVLPEGFAPYDRLTGREHVRYAAGLKGVSADPEELLDRVGLERDAWDRRAGGYSTGMAQRLALATALVGDPDLLVLDEPQNGLDPEGMAEVRRLIRREAEDGTTVFFSTHILSEVEAVCDRIGMLVDGRLAAVGSLADLRGRGDGRVPLSLSLEAVPGDLPADLAAMVGVESVDVADGRIDVELDDPARKIEVIRAVDARATVEDVVAESASLEATFHRLAGTDGVESRPGGRAPTLEAGE